MRELRAGRKFPEMRAGDLVEVQQFPYITAKEPVKFRGILIAKSNNLAETRLRILSVSQVQSPLFPLNLLHSFLNRSSMVLNSSAPSLSTVH